MSAGIPERRAGSRVASIKYALRGIRILVQSQQNARIHAVATVVVVVAGIGFRISPLEWALIAFAVTLVWVAEGLNTALEYLVDLASPEHQPLAGKVKDLAAGAVLLAAIGALAVGVVVFGSPLSHLLLRLS